MSVQEALKGNWKKLKAMPNVLNVGVSTKWKDGKDTGIPCITVCVKKKVAPSLLAPNEMVPKEVGGIPTDVVELSPKTWIADKTSVSEQDPQEQRRRASGVRKQ